MGNKDMAIVKYCDACEAENAIELAKCSDCGNDTFSTVKKMLQSPLHMEPTSSIGSSKPVNLSAAGLISLGLFSLLLAVIALTVSGDGKSSEVASALSNYTENSATTTTVYQQEVTSSWAQKDLLTAIAHQNEVLITQAKLQVFVGSILVLSVVGSALYLGRKREDT